MFQANPVNSEHAHRTGVSFFTKKAYFDQNIVLWFLLLAMISAMMNSEEFKARETEEISGEAFVR